MPRLGDLVGSLMAEFTLARVRADLEAVKLVELYRSESLLEGAPVPRFRLPDITVDLPVLMLGLEGDGDATGFARPSTDAVRSAIREAAVTTGVSLDDVKEAELVAAIDAHLESVWQTSEPIDRAVLHSRAISRVAESLLQKQVEPKVPAGAAASPAREVSAAASASDSSIKSFTKALELRLSTKAIGASGQGPRVMMAAKTSEVREVGDSSLVTRIGLTFKEDGFEVVSVERPDGSSQLRLTPE